MAMWLFLVAFWFGLVAMELPLVVWNFRGDFCLNITCFFITKLIIILLKKEDFG